MPLKVITAQAQLPCAAEPTPVLRVFVRSGIIPERGGRQTSIHRHPAASSMAEAQPSPAQAIDFLTLLQNLKKTKRTGWVRKGVLGPESIADHMYRMSLMSFISTGSNVDSNRCIKLAIVHDVAEAIVGDIAPSDNVTKEVKNQLETEAMHKIRHMLGADSAAGHEIEALWQEYEDGRSPEALMVKDFDKLEMILQAQEYEAEQNIDLQDFFDSTKGRFTTPVGQAWAKEIVKRRADRQSLGHGKGSS